MAFKKKSYKIINGIKVPRPPQGASHIILKCDNGKGAMVAIKDIDTLYGTAGAIHSSQVNFRSKKLMKEFQDKYKWNGREVEEMIGVED